MSPISTLKKLGMFFWSLLFAAAAVAATEASSFPTRPVMMMVPYPAGGLSDAVARLINTSLSHQLGQPVAVENLGGASGAIAAQKVLVSRPVNS